MIKNKISISTAENSDSNSPILLNGSIEKNINQAHKMGYDAIEIHMRENELRGVDLKILKKLMKEKKISISAIVTGKLFTEGKCSLLAEEPYILDATLNGIFEYIDIASKLNTNLIIGWLKGKILDENKRHKSLERLAMNVEVIDKEAERRGVRLFFEAINRYETNLFNTCDEILQFIDSYRFSNSFVHLDTFHMNIEERNLVEAIILAGNRLGYIHFADNNRYYPGYGSIDFVNILKALKDISYSGYISVECLPFPNADIAAKKSLNYIREIL